MSQERKPGGQPITVSYRHEDLNGRPGLTLEIDNERRFWFGQDDSGEPYDFRAERFLTIKEAFYRIQALANEKNHSTGV